MCRKWLSLSYCQEIRHFEPCHWRVSFFVYFLQILILTMQMFKTATCFVNYLCRIGKSGSESEASICVTFERFFFCLRPFWFNGTFFTCGSQIIFFFLLKLIKFQNVLIRLRWITLCFLKLSVWLRWTIRTYTFCVKIGTFKSPIYVQLCTNFPLGLHIVLKICKDTENK
jgi:hypothetical protein